MERNLVSGLTSQSELPYSAKTSFDLFGQRKKISFLVP